MPDGTRAYRPLAGRGDREGLIPSLFMQNPESPLFVDRAEIDPNAGTASQVMTGARNVGANLVNSLSSPGSMLTLGMGGLMSSGATKAIGGLFAADVARYVPEIATEAGTASVTGSPGEIVESFGNLGLAGVGMLGGGIHAAKVDPRGNALRALSQALDESSVQPGSGEFSPIGEFSAPDTLAVAALDPARGEWQPLAPSQLPAAQARGRLNNRMAVSEAVGEVANQVRKDADASQRFSESVMPEVERPAPRADAESGRLGFRRGAEETASTVPEPSIEAIRKTDVESGPGAWRNLNNWADTTISDSRGRASSGIDPTLVGAYAIKAADIVARGAVKTYEVFRDEFVKRFPDAENMARDVWNRLNASDESIFKAIDESSGVEGLNEATRRFGGSVTSLAYRVGERTNTPAQLARLKEGIDKVRRDSISAMDRMKKAASEGGDYVPIANEISAMSMKGQLYREAYEYATGTGSAGLAMKTKDSSFVPPMERQGGDRFLSMLDSGIEKLKTDRTKVMEGVSGLPEWLGRETARGALQAVRAAYVGSKSLASAIESGVKWLQEQGIKADPEAMKDWFDSQLRWERIGTEADAGPVKTRKSIERAMSSKDVSQPVKEMLAQDPQSKYQQQIVNPKKGKTSVADIVASQTDAQLEDATPNSSIFVEQKKELAKRLMRIGRDEAAYQVFSDLASRGTTFGQLVNQFKSLKDVDPSYVARLLNRQLNEHGYDPLTEKQASSLTDKSKKAIESNDKLEQAKKEWVENPTDENAKKAERLLEELKVPAMELQRAMLDMQPKNLPATLKAVIQGNLLTPASQVANIAGNLSIMPFRAASDAVATALDALDSFVRKQPRQLVANPVGSAKAGARGVVKGLKQIPTIAKEGISGVRTGENFRDLQPVRAWVRQFSKENIVPTRGGKIPAGDRAAMAVEGTVGIPAAVSLRGLSIGDAPFREKAHLQAVEQQLELAKIPKDQRPFARKFPELVLDLDAMARIDAETKKAIFQSDSKAVSAVNQFFRSLGKDKLGRNGADWADLTYAILAAPYRLTPWNLVGEYLSYSPAGLVPAVLHLAKGNKLGAERAFAKVAVGGMAAYAAMWLYEKGLLAPSLDAEDEQQKARLLSGSVMPPNHVNLSGATRALSGGDPSFKPGDTTVGVEKLGIFGSVANYMANIGRKQEKSPEGQGASTWDWTIGQVPETAKFALNQSFLKGTATVLDAVRTGKFDDVLRNIENIIVSVPLPNTLSAASRATSESKPVIKDDDKLKEFNNLIQQRLRVFGAGKDLPVKRGVWGEPIPETPEGSNPFAYHFLDITKGQQATQDAASVEAYRLWRKYNDPSVIPTPPAASIVVDGERFILTPEQQSEFQRLVGEERKRRADLLVLNPNFTKQDDDYKRRRLTAVYETGLRFGKRKFLREYEDDLKAKGRPAGFVPQ